MLAARLLQFAYSASEVEGKGLRRQGARDTLGGPFPDRRVHVPTGLAAHATVVCIGHQSLLRLRVVSGYHRSLRVLLTVVGGSAKMIEVGHLFEAYGYSTQGYHIFLASDLSQAEADRPQEEQDLVSSAFTVAEVERMICEGVIKDGVTVAVFGLLRLKGLL